MKVGGWGQASNKVASASGNADSKPLRAVPTSERATAQPVIRKWSRPRNSPFSKLARGACAAKSPWRPKPSGGFAGGYYPIYIIFYGKSKQMETRS